AEPTLSSRVAATTSPAGTFSTASAPLILNNLIVNGAEAVENVHAGLVVAATRLESVGSAEYATITVTDNGPGFTREVLGRVFDPYVTSKPKGTGLGLAIVKKIVEE